MGGINWFLVVTYKYKNKHKHKLVGRAEFFILCLHRQDKSRFNNLVISILQKLSSLLSNFCKVLLHLTLVIKQNMYWCNIAEGKTMRVEATGFQRDTYLTTSDIRQHINSRLLLATGINYLILTKRISATSH